MTKRKGKQREETDEERQARQRLAVEAYEVARGMVPGTAQHDGTEALGGLSWEGAARMAAARHAADLPLNDQDIEALSRFPDPGGWVGSEA